MAMTIREEGYAEGYRDGYSQRDGEIVRCKDCKHGEEPILAYGKWCVWCKRIDRHNGADWYCADGEPKDGDEE